MKFGTWKFYKVDKEEDEQATALPMVYRIYSSQKTLDNIHLSLRKGLFTTISLAPTTVPGTL